MEKNGRAVVALLILIMGVLLFSFDVLLQFNYRNSTMYLKWIITPVGLFLMAKALDGKLRTTFYALTALEILRIISSYLFNYYVKADSLAYAEQIVETIVTLNWGLVGAFLLGYGIWFFYSKNILLRIGIVFLVVELFNPRIIWLVSQYTPDDRGLATLVTMYYLLPFITYVGYSLIALGYAESKRLVSSSVFGVLAMVLCFYYGIKHNDVYGILLCIGTGLLCLSLYGVGRFYNLNIKSVVYAILSIVLLNILVHIPLESSISSQIRLVSMLLYFFAAYRLFRVVNQSEQKPYLAGLKWVAVILAMSPVVLHLYTLPLSVMPKWLYSFMNIACALVGSIGWIKLYSDYRRKLLARGGRYLTPQPFLNKKNESTE